MHPRFRLRAPPRPPVHFLRIIGCPFRMGQNGLVVRVELPKHIDDLSQASFEGEELSLD